MFLGKCKHLRDNMYTYIHWINVAIAITGITSSAKERGWLTLFLKIYPSICLETIWLWNCLDIISVALYSKINQINVCGKESYSYILPYKHCVQQSKDDRPISIFFI